MKTLCWSIAACLVMPVALVMADDSVRLQYKLQKGDVLRYRTVTETRMSIPGDTAKLRWDCKTSISRIEVGDVDSQGIAAVRMTEESSRWEKTGSNGMCVYDSQHPRPAENDEEKAMSIMGGAIGVTVEMRMSPHGTVKFADFDKLITSLAANANDPKVTQTLSELKGAVPGDWTGGAGEAFPVLPSTSVQLGDGWGPRSNTMKGPFGTVTSQSTSTLEGIEQRKEGRRAHFTVSDHVVIEPGTMKPLGEASTLITPGPTESVSQVVFDMEQGRVLRIAKESVSTSIWSLPGGEKRSNTTEAVVRTTVSLIEEGRAVEK